MSHTTRTIKSNNYFIFLKRRIKSPGRKNLQYKDLLLISGQRLSCQLFYSPFIFVLRFNGGGTKALWLSDGISGSMEAFTAHHAAYWLNLLTPAGCFISQSSVTGVTEVRSQVTGQPHCHIDPVTSDPLMEAAEAGQPRQGTLYF